MRKNHIMTGTTCKSELILEGETNASDKGVFWCDILMLGIFLWNQLYYGMDMLLLIIPLFLLGIWIAAFAWIPEKYCFADSHLEVRHKFQRTIKIPYENVFNYDTSVRDGFINILGQNTVKVYYYIPSEKKRVALCRPRDAECFTEILRARCPEFYTEENQSSLQVFFDDRNKKGD